MRQRNRARERRDPCYWLADREPLRVEWEWTGRRDRLTPLWRYLDKSCGRPWNDVRREIRRRMDRRNIRGFHLWEHVQLVVEGAGGRTRPGCRRSGWHVDANGVLRSR